MLWTSRVLDASEASQSPEQELQTITVRRCCCCCDEVGASVSGKAETYLDERGVLASQIEPTVKIQSRPWDQVLAGNKSFYSFLGHYASRTDNIVQLLFVEMLSCCFHMLTISLCAVSSWYRTTMSCSVFILGMYDIYFSLASGRECSSVIIFRIGTIPNYYAFQGIIVMTMIIIDLCYTFLCFVWQIKRKRAQLGKKSI